MKFQYIAEYRGTLTRSHLCRLMGVSERGLHAWKHRPPSHRQRRDMVLLAHIRDQHRLSLGSYGRPRMTEELNELGIRVVPLVGPVSLLLALATSGLNGQNFAFVGYLPQDGAARTQRLRELENLAAKHGQTQLFIETPYRNQALWDALVNGLQGNTRLARASGLTMATMQVHCKTVQAWRSAGKVQISGEPTVFLIGK